MNRRFFTMGLSTIGLNACQFFPQSKSLNIELISGAIPGKLINEFNRLQPIKLTPNITKNYDELTKSFTKSPDNIGILSIGDGWLSTITSLLQEIDFQQLSNFNLIPLPWRSVGKINNAFFAIPYRWGATVIIYNQNKFKQHNIPFLTAWQDLWHPQLKQKISLPDNDREVIGLCLKRRGASYNGDINNQLEEDIFTLNQQVLVYNSHHYVQSLIHEDTWAAVGWSGDVIEIVKRYPQLKIVYPQEGTALWFDCWCISKNLTDVSVAYKWIDYCINPDRSQMITALTRGNGISAPQKLLAPDYLDRCEPILPLAQKTDRQYKQMWQELRQKT